jgi:shikimate dehydrogenase
VQKRAKELNLKYADGMWMLIYQGARSFEIWTGQKAPVDEMLKGFLEDTPCVLH